jgi:hypothetical protein
MQTTSSLANNYCFRIIVSKLLINLLKIIWKSIDLEMKYYFDFKITIFAMTEFEF